MARVTADGEKHRIYKKTNKIGKGKPGDIMVNHPTTDKGKWDTINLTKKAGAKTVKQGVAATKKWHRENPYPKPKMQKGGSMKTRSIDPGFSNLPKDLKKASSRDIDPGFSKIDTTQIKKIYQRKIKSDPVTGGVQYKNGGSTPAWQRKEGKSPSGGLNAKGRASLKAAGHDIKAPQPEGGPRKKSFCARMSGMKKKLTSAKTANDPNSRINKSLRKWKC